jgi:hypothetical protein
MSEAKEPQPFQVGDKVRAVLVGGPPWIDDWRDVEMWVSGIRFSVSSGGWDIDISDRWPPTRGSITDGWTDLDLAKD